MQYSHLRQEIQRRMEWIMEALADSLKMLPFLFAAFLCMEALEHYAGRKWKSAMRRTGAAGPAVGAVLGCIPQCGFSVMASNLYAGGVITLGTLMAVYMATSDEAVLLMLADPGHGKQILWLLAAKVLIGMAAGYLVDLLVPPKKRHHHTMGEVCTDCGCHDHHGILKPALKHTGKIFLYILAFTLVLNGVLELIGLERLSAVLLSDSVFQPLLAALLGLIPNCAASVALTELYLGGAISFASVVAGLCTGAGIGLVVLFRVNHDRKENFRILGMLYLLGALSGVLLEVFG